MDERYTSEGLPILTTQTIAAFNADMRNNSDDDNIFLKKLVNEISDNLIRSYITDVTIKYPPQLQKPVLGHLVGLYKLLQLQGNNYKIEQLWGLDDSKKD